MAKKELEKSLTEEQIAELESKNGKIAIIRGPNKEFELVIRAPKRTEWKMYKVNATSDSRKLDAIEILLRKILVYPTLEEFDKLLDDYCGLCENIALQDAIATLAGIRGNEDLKA